MEKNKTAYINYTTKIYKEEKKNIAIKIKNDWKLLSKEEKLKL
jgi:hypothetical protein